MKIEEIRSKNDTELEFVLENLKKELFESRYRVATDVSADPSKIWTTKKAIARILTVLDERASGTRGQGPVTD